MVSQKKPRNRKSKAVINLSESVEVSEKFEVKNYDYKDLQQPLDPFEKDLDYLLGGKEDAVFRETGVTEELIIHELVLPVEDVASRAKKRFSRNGKKLAVLANDIASDIQDLNFSSSDEENVSPKKENQPKKKTGKKKKKQQQSEVAVADGVGAEDEADELDVKSALKFVQGILVEEKEKMRRRNV